MLPKSPGNSRRQEYSKEELYADGAKYAAVSSVRHRDAKDPTENKVTQVDYVKRKFVFAGVLLGEGGSGGVGILVGE